MKITLFSICSTSLCSCAYLSALSCNVLSSEACERTITSFSLKFLLAADKFLLNKSKASIQKPTIVRIHKSYDITNKLELKDVCLCYKTVPWIVVCLQSCNNATRGLQSLTLNCVLSATCVSKILVHYLLNAVSLYQINIYF